jgi:uncharacterized protein YcbK (DUF882 family)
MTKLTKNLSRKEFACKCECGFNTVDYELVLACQDLADHFEDVIYINSGCRCESHNKSVGGSKNSQHVLGRAADVRLKHTPPDRVQEYLHSKYPNLYGIGSYENFTHIDTRSGKARWKG